MAGRDVVFKIPSKNLFVGSFFKVPVEIDPASGLTFDDLEFIVPDGPQAGQVSLSRDWTFDPTRPDIMLLGGYEPGTYRLQAVQKGTGTVAGEDKFVLDALWTDDEVGPPLWFNGMSQGYSSGSAWGGGPSGPQNINVFPALGTRRIAILLVDTSSQRFTTDPADLQAHRDRWMDETINGVTSGGVTRSTRAYFREVSYGNFDLTAQVFGPVQLPGEFDDYFRMDGAPLPGYFQACFTAGDDLIDYNNFDTLLCVSQSVTTPPMRSAWPNASLGHWGPFTTAEGRVNYGVISMPNEWGLANDREIHETLAHELGHNLGLGDQYTPGVTGRNTGGWELMDSDDPLPHLSLAHRMMLGWVPAGDIQTFNFQTAGSTVDQTVTLHPAELGAPAPGRRRGIEVRLTDGWNYYLEYRVGQGAQIGDQNLPTDNRVLGTDVTSAPYTPPFARPGLLLLPNDGDDDGAVLGNGDEYKELDQGDPSFPVQFRADVSGIDSTKADVRIRYGISDRPDPSIRPWPAGPDRQWESPDIEVRNARNMADPEWFNVPWDGNMNTVVARVKNSGAFEAPQVRVNFYVQNFNVGGAPEAFLGTDVKDIPAGATVELTTTWTPPSEGHYCIIVRIVHYQHPTRPTLMEVTELNNLARSNYDRFISRTASPASRESSSVEVSNPYPERTLIILNAGQTNPLYRTYLGSAWMTLDPGEVRKVPVMFEYAVDPDHPRADPDLARYLEQYRWAPNDVKFAAFIEDPRDNPRHAIDLLGGAQVEVVTGRATDIRDFEVSDGAARGVIVALDNNEPISGGGRVILCISTDDGEPQAKIYQTIEFQGGRFTAPLAHDGPWESIEAYYVPVQGFADCTSRRIRR